MAQGSARTPDWVGNAHAFRSKRRDDDRCVSGQHTIARRFAKSVSTLDRYLAGSGDRARGLLRGLYDKCPWGFRPKPEGLRMEVRRCRRVGAVPGRADRIRQTNADMA